MMSPGTGLSLIGDHPSIVALRALITRVARSKAQTVLIYGETGTGKGLVARLIHQQSVRAAAEFIDINCAAIPAELLESELFGHERGAFTGAVGAKTGLIEAANGGTLFLDEVRELDPVMQAKILTLLDNRRFRRVGAVKPIHVDVRFIAATNKILLGEVKAGLFRDDLYYRLQVIAINIPPLRERGDDVFLLAEHALLLRDLAARHRFCVAVDVPSGIASDSGAVLNDRLPVFDLTLALGAWKFAHWSLPGRALMGQMRLVPIGIAAVPGAAVLATRPKIAAPAAESHKYLRGLLGIVAGAMPGASLLAAAAAQHAGAGYVKLFAAADGRAPPDLVIDSGPLSEALSDTRLNALLVPLRSAERGAHVLPLYEEPLAMFVAAEHPLAGRIEVSPEELAAETMVARRSCEFLDATSRFFTRHRVRPRFALRSDSDDRCLRMVAAGIGITTAPVSLAIDGIVPLKVAGYDFRRELGLPVASADEKPASQPVELLVEGPVRARPDTARTAPRYCVRAWQRPGWRGDRSRA